MCQECGRKAVSHALIKIILDSSVVVHLQEFEFQMKHFFRRLKKLATVATIFIAIK